MADYYAGWGDQTAPCSPREHNWQMNGVCHACKWTRDALIAQARATLAALG